MRSRRRLVSTSESGPITGIPTVNCKTCNQRDDEKHPILDFDAKNVDMLDKKLHRRRPFFVQGMCFGDKNILLLYSVAPGITQRLVISALWAARQ